MSARLNVAHLNYQLFPSITDHVSAFEESKLKALLGLEHITGLGHLLRCIEIDFEGSSEKLAQQIDDANDGICTAADLIVLIGDLAYHEVEQMDRLHHLQIARLQPSRQR